LRPGHESQNPKNWKSNDRPRKGRRPLTNFPFSDMTADEILRSKEFDQLIQAECVKELSLLTPKNFALTIGDYRLTLQTDEEIIGTFCIGCFEISNVEVDAFPEGKQRPLDGTFTLFLAH
jgi:hypothetical protein